MGCGGGYLARLLAAAIATGGRVTGVDPSGPAIAYARRRAPANCTFTVAAAQDLPLPDRSFDVATSTLALHHIPEAPKTGVCPSSGTRHGARRSPVWHNQHTQTPAA